ncbi:MAG: Glu/Leu/Phe/Val family dehydrogenase [Chromatiales bacterium]
MGDQRIVTGPGAGRRMVWQQDNMQLVCTVTADSRVLGFVVIDSTVGGRACGGLRMLPDVDEAEMRGLARAMTLKHGFVGLPLGGAKAGVRADPETSPEERQQRLLEFGRTIAPLLSRRIYIPGADMGTTPADIRQMLVAIGMRPARRDLRATDSGYFTALTVLVGMEQAARHLRIPLSKLSIAIEGYGKVGRSLATVLDKANVRVVAISTRLGAIYNPKGLNVVQLNQCVAEHGDGAVDLYPEADRIEREALPELPVDVLCPCARHDSIHSSNAARIKARVICPGANNPVTPEAERLLFERGVLCLPDFVTNCGGVLGGAMEYAALSKSQTETFIPQHVGPRIAALLDEAGRRQVLPREIAVPLALQRFEQIRRGALRPSLFSRLRGASVLLYRYGWLPASLVAPASLSYFARTLR